MPQLVTETVRGTNSFLFSSKIDQIWNANFTSSLRANVGVISVERQGGGLRWFDFKISRKRAAT
jgi:hypothetical protein